jgi:hypothetical protein
LGETLVLLEIETANRNRKLETGTGNLILKPQSNMYVNMNPSYARYTNALYIYSLVLTWNYYAT